MPNSRTDGSHALATSKIKEHGTTEWPWGTLTTVYESEVSIVHVLRVNPRTRLSLRQNFEQMERWTITQGTAEVRHGGQIHSLRAGASILIPTGAVHGLENAGDTPLTLVQVQLSDEVESDRLAEHIVASTTEPAPPSPELRGA